MHLVPSKYLLPEHQSKRSLRFRSEFVLLADDTDFVGLGRLVSPEGQVQHWELQSGQLLELSVVTQWAWLSKPNLDAEATAAGMDKLLDEDGYPTEYAHRQLRLWNDDDPMGWFLFAQKIWYFKNFFHIEELADKWVVHVSTAGWSGNEGLLNAMKQHEILWSSVWCSHRRGGHYTFEIDKED